MLKRWLVDAAADTHKHTCIVAVWQHSLKEYSALQTLDCIDCIERIKQVDHTHTRTQETHAHSTLHTARLQGSGGRLWWAVGHVRWQPFHKWAAALCRWKKNGAHSFQ